jgi:NADH-quinone oxidoreductase subunit G
MEISAYIEKSVDHELSGNIIDLCPVGALNNKPYRFSARAWEMVQQPTVSPHDCAGSNLNAHVWHGKIKRVVPRVNEAINETWIADRDRFGCEGIYADDRLEAPLVRENGDWRQCSWEAALEFAAAGLQRVGGSLAGLVSPSATTEEGYLFGRLIRQLGSNDVDHRLRRTDFRQQELDPIFPWLGMTIAEVEVADAVLVVGSNLRREVPILAHRLRKTALRGAAVSFVNPGRYEYLFPVANYFTAADLVAELGGLVQAAADRGGAGGTGLSPAVAELIVAAPMSADEHRETVSSLSAASAGVILLGQICMRHPRFAELRLLAAELARLTGAQLGYVPEGANSAGLSLAGVLPHRGVGGAPVDAPGATAAEIVANPARGLMLLGVEPELDCGDGEAALEAMASAEFVVALSPFRGRSLDQHADVILPMGTFAETSGTYVNVAGDWQSFAGVAEPFGESRPGWKILRVLGNLLDMPDCDYLSADEVRDEVRQLLGRVSPDNDLPLDAAPGLTMTVAPESGCLEVPMYRIDPLVRRAQCLQDTRDGRLAVSESAEDRKIA